MLAFGGDVVLGRWVNGPEGSIWRENRNTLAPETRALLGAADLAVVNLETALCDHATADRGRPHLRRQHFRLTAPPASADRLVDWGVHVAVVANNHAMDCGVESMRHTLGALQDRGVRAAGVRSSGQGPFGEPLIVTLAGAPVVILATTTHPAPIDLLDSPAPELGPATALRWQENIPALAQQVAHQREIHGDGALLIVSLHWGQEGSPEPLERQRAAARALVEAGADVLFGHGPHRLHETELLDGAAVLYSAGDLLFDGHAADHVGLITLRATPPSGSYPRWRLTSP